MSRRACDGRGLLGAFRAAVVNIEAHVDEINALNVYPVPDGDTGSNMLATVKAALAEAETVADEPADRIAGAVSFGALMGARGNSGVIASQIFRGMADGLGGKKRFNGLDLAHALSVGSATAYKAVTKPVEGTILTVIREAAAAAVATAEADGDLEAVLTSAVEAAERAVARTPSLLPVLREAGVVDAGGEGLYRLLQGALQFLVAQTPAVRTGPTAGARASALVAHADEGFGYETMFLLQGTGVPLDLDLIRNELEQMGDSVLVAGDSRAVKVHVHNARPDKVLALGLAMGTLTRISVENLDAQAQGIRERRAGERGGRRERVAAEASGSNGTEPAAMPELEAAASGSTGAPGRVATSVTVHGAAAAAGAGVANAANANVPALATATLDPAVRPGERAIAPVERAPMPGDGLAGDGRHAAIGAEHAAAAGERATTGGAGPASGHLALAVVAVAAGDGLAQVFESFGVAAVVRGGQANNPSTGELLEAVERLDADEVLVLPNNPNVVLAARQVAELTHRRVRVVPTRNAAEGVAALLALDPGRDATANAEVMTLASRGVQTFQVTEAVRDAVIGGRKVKKGQTIALGPDDGLLAADGDRYKALVAALEALEPGFELLTVYYGDGADLAEAESVARRLGEWRRGVEVEVVHGGQPHYRYLIAAE